MYHPQPQHPPSAQRHFPTEFIQGYPPSQNTAPNIQDSRQAHSKELDQPQGNFGKHQYAMSVRSPVPPSLETHTTENYHGFQVSATRFPVGSPTFALRPVTAPFSHIEYPNLSPAHSQPSDGYDSEPIATAYDNLHSRENSYSDRPVAYEGTGLGFGYASHQESQSLCAQSHQISSERSQEGHGFDAAAQQMERMGTLRPPVRRRVRGDSNSSAASVWSSIAVAGDPVYHNDVFFDDANMNSSYRAHGSPAPESDQFQPYSASANYSYNAPILDGNRYTSTTNAIMQDNFSPSPAGGMDIDPPVMVPPAPRPDELELQDPDHPFTYQGADWDVSRGAFSVASTDGDAASLHSQDRLSSRDSSEPIQAGRRGRKTGTTASPAMSEQRKASGEGRKKTVMACHFCRFRKLRCDGGQPCTHCQHREKECTYDTTIRRRGPGRRNKSAQETARVQLANRQREEAARGEAAEKETKQSIQGRTTRSKAPKEETHKDAWSQTSPPINQFPASFSENGISFYPLDARSQVHFPTPDDSPTGRKEYQAISIPFESVREQEPAALRPARELAQQMPLVHRSQTEGHRRVVSGAMAPGLQTPVSQESSSYYDGSPDQTSSQRQYYPPSAAGYGSNRYSIATTQGGDSNYSHTDSESAYAYSEGANVLPYDHGYQRQPRQQQPDMQGRFRPATGFQYSREAGGDVTMINAYSDTRTRIEGYGARR